MDVTESLSSQDYRGLHEATVGDVAPSQDASQEGYASLSFNLPVWFAPDAAANAQTFELTESFDPQSIPIPTPESSENAEPIDLSHVLPNDDPQEDALLAETAHALPRVDHPIDLSNISDVSDTPIALPDLSQEPTVEIKSLMPQRQEIAEEPKAAQQVDEQQDNAPQESLAQEKVLQEAVAHVDAPLASENAEPTEVIEDIAEPSHELVFDETLPEETSDVKATHDEPSIEPGFLKEAIASQTEVRQEITPENVPDVTDITPRELATTEQHDVHEVVEENVDAAPLSIAQPKRRPLERAREYVREFRHAVDSVEARLIFLGRKKRPWAVALFLSLICCPPLGALAWYYFARVFTSIMRQDVTSASHFLEETRKTLRSVAVWVFVAMCLFLLRLALIDSYEG